MSSGTEWRVARFEELSGGEVYEVLALRQQVFLVEQRIPVLDADGLDAEALHLLGRRGGDLRAYARLFLPCADRAAAKIARVVVAEQERGRGMGRELMREALNALGRMAPGAPVKVAAQAHLERFYRALGFVTVSAPHDEGGVSHLDMVRQD